MASFCTKCGAQVSPDNQFCTACGASSAAGAAVATSLPPAAAPARSGGSAVKVILIVVAVFIGMGIIGAGIFGYGVWRISRAVHVSGGSGADRQVTINTPGGTITADSSEKFTASELGTEIYPGARPGHGSMRMEMPTGSMVTATFITSASKDQVLAFYKANLGSAATVVDMPDGAILTLPRGQQESVTVTITSKPSENDGKTKIAIVHTKSNKPS
jgi:hypothetical protein